MKCTQKAPNLWVFPCLFVCICACVDAPMSLFTVCMYVFMSFVVTPLPLCICAHLYRKFRNATHTSGGITKTKPQPQVCCPLPRVCTIWGIEAGGWEECAGNRGKRSCSIGKYCLQIHDAWVLQEYRRGSNSPCQQAEKVVPQLCLDRLAMRWMRKGIPDTEAEKFLVGQASS